MNASIHAKRPAAPRKPKAAPRGTPRRASLALAAIVATTLPLLVNAALPTATSLAPSNVTQTSATLRGSVSPGGLSTSVSFQGGTTTAYGGTMAASPSTISATAGTTAVSVFASGLKCGTTYHYRVRASNASGTRYGADVAFTTASCGTTTPPPPTATAPAATTTAASAINATGATLNGNVNAGGASTSVTFNLGATTAYGTNATASPATVTGTTTTAVSAAVSGLACNTTYHYRVSATNSAGTTRGADATFTTGACTTTPPPPPPPDPTPTPTPTLDCSSNTVHCVDDTAGATQEYSTIQAAVNVAQAGHTVLVHDGTYAGFVVSRSGTASAPITVKAAGTNALINRVNSANEGIRVSNASHVVIEGFRITGMPAFGLTARGASPSSPMRGVVFRGNVVTNSASVNIYASQITESLIEGNTASGSGSSHGIYLANGGSDNSTIRGNIAHSNAKNGIHLNGDLSVGGDGLHSGIVIEDNILYNNTANAMDLDGIQSSTIRNNIIYGNGRHGVRAFRLDAAAGPKSLTIVNNTISIPSSASANPIKLSEDLGGHTIFNNILLNDSSAGSIVTGSAAVKSNFNVVGGSGTPSFSTNGGSSMLSLAQWRANLANDLDSILSSAGALFVNAAAADYRLRSGAPAANTGRGSFNGAPAPAKDIDDAARPRGGQFDVGAHESF